MRDIKYIAIHCSATKTTADIGVKEIRKWHVEGNGWADIGYHFVIRRNGQVETGRALERAGAHVTGYNANSIGICMVGGINAAGKAESNYTDEQWASLRELVIKFKNDYPKAVVQGHRDFPNVKKDCPCFSVKDWLKKEGI